MLDVPNEASDKLLASHILDIYSNKEAHHIKYHFYYLVWESIGRTLLPNISAMLETMLIQPSQKMQVVDSQGPTWK